MKLDDNLVRSFSDTINRLLASKTESIKNSKETTHYGTVISKDGNECTVQLDGSSSTTPATLLVDAIPGERVAVRIKNRHAEVTANVTSPSAVMDIGRAGSYRIHVDGDEVTFIDSDGNSIGSLKAIVDDVWRALGLEASELILRTPSDSGNGFETRINIIDAGSYSNPSVTLSITRTSDGASSYITIGYDGITAEVIAGGNNPKKTGIEFTKDRVITSVYAPGNPSKLSVIDVNKDRVSIQSPGGLLVNGSQVVVQ